MALPSWAQSLSEVALFNRCYSQLTGNPVPLGHATMAQIRAGTKKALPACQALIEKAELDAATGALTQINDPEARNILNNFYDFHRSWFPANTVEQIQEYNPEMSIGTMDIYDSTEPGLALTRALFATGAKYSDVLTLPTGVAALRQEKASVRNIFGYTVNIPLRRLVGNNAGFDQNLFHFRSTTGGPHFNSELSTSQFMVLPKVQIGELVGVRPRTESLTIPNVELAPLGTTRPGHVEPGLNFQFNLYGSFGGGVLGSPIYMMLNYGHGRGVAANGTTKIPRRWSQNSMSSFLCVEIPALRETDIRNYVVGNSSTPFRNSSSCVMCHATIDPMAYTARNVVVANSDYQLFSEGARMHSKAALHLTSYRPEIPSVAGWPAEPVANFHRQTPSGRLFYRSMTGALVDRQVASISDLGKAMTETEDYYACAAKRYFQFMTGIVVPLYDRSNPQNAEVNRQLSVQAIEDRKFVEALGQELKRTQSLKTLVKSILASKYYQNVNYREEK